MAPAQYPIHPLCHLFPVLPMDGLNGLAEDIGRRGLMEAIVLLDGMDGRNRLLRRRQFNASQRAVIALTVLPLMEKEARERTQQSEGRGKKGAQYCAPFSEGEFDEEPRSKHRAVEDARLLGASPRLSRLPSTAPINGGAAQKCATLLQREERARGAAVEEAGRLLGAGPRYTSITRSRSPAS